MNSIHIYPYNTNDKKHTLDTISEWNFSKNWPVTYIIYNNEKAYVGETLDAIRRTEQHLNEEEFNCFTQICLISSLSFNKSVILDLESYLIKYMSADGLFKLTNENAGIVDHNYFYKEKYHFEFKDIWKELTDNKLAKRSLNDIENSELFKYSPYKALSEEQKTTVDKILRDIIEINNSCTADYSTSKSVVKVLGGAGTGKTIIAVYLVKLLKDIIDKKRTWELLDDEEEASYIRTLSENIGGINRIGFVVPMEKLRDTMKKIFSSIDGLNPSMVLSPEDVTKSYYDVLVVDEVHRLYKRKHRPTNRKNLYNEIDKINSLIMPAGTQTRTEDDFTELDWIIYRSKIKILFFDEFQTIRVADIGKERFEKSCMCRTFDTLELHSQMRCNGGTGYYEYIKSILHESNLVNDNNFRKQFSNYEVRIFDGIDELKSAIENKKDDLCCLMAGPAWGMNEPIIIESQSFIWEGQAKTNSGDFISSIHKTQGFDKNYAGVILSKELIYDEEERRVSINKNELKDKFMVSAKDFDSTRQRVLNLYLTLLTRGIKGTYIYAMDEKLREYLKKFF